MSDDLKINLPASMLTEPETASPQVADSNGEAREASYERQARGGQNSLASSNAATRSTGDKGSEIYSKSPSQNLQQERGDVKCQDNTRWIASATTVATKLDPRSSAAPTFKPEGAACPPNELAPTDSREKQPSLRPSPISGVTPPIATRWKKGESGNPGGRCKHVSRAYIKHLETVVDEETGETNADKIAKAQIKKASSEKDDGSTAAAREIRQATETDDEANKGGFNIGSLNVAILNQIQRAATERSLE